MRKIKRFYARRGALIAEGASKTEAKAELEKQIEWACNHPAPIVENRFGWTIVLGAVPHGFVTMVIAPNELGHGAQKISSTQSGQGDYGDALESARVHAAQNAWTHDVVDDSEYAGRAGLRADKTRELLSWFRFQRNYRALKLEGKSDAEAFDRANGYARYAVEWFDGI